MTTAEIIVLGAIGIFVLGCLCHWLGWCSGWKAGIRWYCANHLVEPEPSVDVANKPDGLGFDDIVNEWSMWESGFDSGYKRGMEGRDLVKKGGTTDDHLKA